MKTHTWEFLNLPEKNRLSLMTIFTVIFFAVGLMGLLNVWGIKGRKIPDTKRRWHRKLGYVLWIAACTFPISGVYHLYTQSALDAPVPMLMMADPTEAGKLRTSFEVAKLTYPLADAVASLGDGAVIDLSLANMSDGTVYYRFQRWMPKLVAPMFAPKPDLSNLPTDPAIYINAQTGQRLEGGELAYVTDLAPRLIRNALIKGPGVAGLNDAKVVSATLQTAFDDEYNMLRMHLPVWKVQFDDGENTRHYINAQLAKTRYWVDDSVMREQWWMQNIHLWFWTDKPFPIPLFHDVVLLAFIIMLITSSIFGIVMHLKIRAARKK